ncbi:MAG: hypothetical protein KDC98_07805 [Planctomycetes bacterium]|nr:hypothetical protein [Planctomycetota bacterium]
MPDVFSSHSSVATAVAEDYGDSHATVRRWVPNGNGTSVYVATFDPAGNPTDAPFHLNYTTNHPAGTLAKNTIIGHGCGSTLLSPITRPVTGTNWTYQVTDAPAGVGVGFILLGLSNPDTDLTPIGMTGCARYTDQLAKSLVLGSFPGQTHSTAIPSVAAFLGINIYAQVALFAPGVNPLGITASNGIKGTIGDV